MSYEIDWGHVDPKYKIATQDTDGSIWLWKDNPSFDGNRWMPPTKSGWGNPRDFCIHYSGAEPIDRMYAELSTQVRPVVANVSVEAIPDESSKGHVHAAQMLAYAQDAAVHKKPWELWEYSSEAEGTNDCLKHPEWRSEHEYRRKPQTVTITIPENVAKDFMRLILVSDAGKAVYSAIEEVLEGKNND